LLFFVNVFISEITNYWDMKQNRQDRVCRRVLSRNLQNSSHLGFLRGLYCTQCLGINFADCCWMNELKFRICTNCKNIQYKVYKPFEKCQRLFINFC